MIRMARFLIWTIVFIVILATVDQLMVRVPLKTAGVQAVQRFYVDFRGRLQRLVVKPARLAPAGGAPTVESIIEKTHPPSPRSTSTETASKEPQLLYVDSQGELRFADSLVEVPERYRASAQRLDP